MSTPGHPPRLAVLFDYPEEHWASMDHCAEMLLENLQAHHADQVEAQRVCPPFRRVLERVPVLGRSGAAYNADRLLNRFRCYPAYVRRRVAGEFDLFHIADHSYAALALELPPERTGVFCHDLDAFRCILEPYLEPRPRWFKAMARRILQGMQRAAVVFHTTGAVREQILHHGIIDAAKLVQAPLGIAPEFSTGAGAELPPPLDEAPFVLHVGSVIPRKRIDVLLNVFAAVRKLHPDLRLVKVARGFTLEQTRQIAELNLGPAITLLSDLDRPTIAALYRQASLILQPSEAEGFGMPVAEALACGGAVVASDIPALREVGGGAVTYCPVADIPAWTQTVLALLDNPDGAPPVAERLIRAALYSWPHHAAIIWDAYRRLAGGGPGSAS